MNIDDSMFTSGKIVQPQKSLWDILWGSPPSLPPVFPRFVDRLAADVTGSSRRARAVTWCNAADMHIRMTKMLPTRKEVDIPSTGHKLPCFNLPWKLGQAKKLTLRLGGKRWAWQKVGTHICCLNDPGNLTFAEIWWKHNKNSPK
jgi:hypothetical protein